MKGYSNLWQKYKRKWFMKDGDPEMDTIEPKPNTVDDSLGFGDYLNIVKNFVLNLFVDVTEGKNPSFSFSKSKTILWAIVVVVVIIITSL